LSVGNGTSNPEVGTNVILRLKAKGREYETDAPASVKNYVEAGTAEGDVCAIDDVSTILDGDAGEIAAFGEVGGIGANGMERDYGSSSKMYGQKEREKERTHGDELCTV
jgi:hypothetical protein